MPMTLAAGEAVGKEAVFGPVSLCVISLPVLAGDCKQEVANCKVDGGRLNFFMIQSP